MSRLQWVLGVVVGSEAPDVQPRDGLGVTVGWGGPYQPALGVLGVNRGMETPSITPPEGFGGRCGLGGPQHPLSGVFWGGGLCWSQPSPSGKVRARLGHDAASAGGRAGGCQLPPHPQTLKVHPQTLFWGSAPPKKQVLPHSYHLQAQQVL